MPTGTLVCKLDTGGDGQYATNVSQYLVEEVAISEIGRAMGSDGGAVARLALDFDNRDGRFSPRNATGAYYPNLKPGMLISLDAVWNSVTYPLYRGVVERIQTNTSKERYTTTFTCLDRMAILANNDLLLPLMREKKTGVIIHRLLDLAETEWLPNPFFAEGTDDWAVIAFASMTRITSGNVLHSAALEVITSAEQGSVQAEFPNAANERMTGAMYIRPRSLVDVGLNVSLQFRDQAGTVGSAAGGALLADDWLRLEVSALFPGSSTNSYLSIRDQSGGGDSDFIIGGAHVTRTVEAVPRAIDVGVGWIEQVGYGRAVSAVQAVQEVRDNELGGLFFFDAEGKATYHDRSHRWADSRSKTSQKTFDETAHFQYREGLDTRFSEIRYYYTSWEPGEPGSKVFSLAPVPRQILDGETLTIEVDYGGGLVRDSIIPVANFDYFLNSAPDGTKTDDSSGVPLSFVDYGAAARVVIGPNALGRRTYLVGLDVRGTPVRPPSDAISVNYVDVEVGWRSVLSHNYPLQTLEAHMSPWLDHSVAKWVAQQEGQLIVTVTAPWPEAATTTHMAFVLGAKVGDRITLVENNLPFASMINGDYYVESISRTIEDKKQVTMVLAVTPVDSERWDLDTDALGSTAVLAV